MILLTPPELIVIAIIVLLFVLIFLTKLKIEIIALLMLLAVTLTGLVSPSDALSGFGSSVVMTLIGLFIITHALEQTGVIDRIAQRLNMIGAGSEVKLITLFMTVGAVLSLVMNNVAAGAVLLPAAVGVARSSNVSVSKLLMPMSFGTLVGGMATYLTTANILMSELLIENGFASLGMFDFIPAGSVVVVAGIAYMLLVGRFLLPQRKQEADNHPQNASLEETYHLNAQQWYIRVGAESKLAHKRIGESAINAQLGLTIAAIWRKRETITIPKSDQILYPDDELLVIGRADRVEDLITWGNSYVQAAARKKQRSLQIEPIEIMIAPRSEAVGQTLSDIKLNSEAGLLALALWRDGESHLVDVRKIPLEVGDAVLVVGKWDDIQALANDDNFILPSGKYKPQPSPEQRKRALPAVLIASVALLLGIFDLIALPIAMLAGAVTMVLIGCLTMAQFYDAISWRVIFLVAGMLPLSIALTDSGLAARVGTIFVSLLADQHPLLLIAGMIVLTMLVVQVIGGQVTALLVGPIAITAAVQTGVDPRVMAVAVAMSCSMAFLTPIAHPVNILMMGPGGYKFSDFLIVGIGMTVVTTLSMLFGLWLFWQI